MAYGQLDRDHPAEAVTGDDRFVDADLTAAPGDVIDQAGNVVAVRGLIGGAAAAQIRVVTVWAAPKCSTSVTR